MWKKLLIAFAILLGSLYIIPPVNTLSTPSFYESSPTFQVIAHGSGQGLKPNNTREAAELSHSLGAIIELDLHASKDGQLIVRHDDTVNATTNGSGMIREKTLV